VRRRRSAGSARPTHAKTARPTEAATTGRSPTTTSPAAGIRSGTPARHFRPRATVCRPADKRPEILRAARDRSTDHAAGRRPVPALPSRYSYHARGHAPGPLSPGDEPQAVAPVLETA